MGCGRFLPWMLIVVIALFLQGHTEAFSPVSSIPRASAARGGGDLTRVRRDMSLAMAGKAQFGFFSPAVYAAKLVLGETKLKNVRGRVSNPLLLRPFARVLRACVVRRPGACLVISLSSR